VSVKSSETLKQAHQHSKTPPVRSKANHMLRSVKHFMNSVRHFLVYYRTWHVNKPYTGNIYSRNLYQNFVQIIM